MDDYEIPPFLRMPERGSRESAEWMLSSIDVHIKKLAALGLRPHVNVLEYQAELLAQLESGGPYVLRSRGGYF